jgi:hypothetical protein
MFIHWYRLRLRRGGKLVTSDEESSDDESQVEVVALHRNRKDVVKPQ